MLKTKIEADRLATAECGSERSHETAPAVATGRTNLFLRGFVVVSSAAVLVTHSSLVNLAIRADQYRHLSRIVIPVFVDGGSVKLLWSNHHPSPFLHLYQYISASTLSFDQRFDFVGGVMGSAAIAWMLVDTAPTQRRELYGNPVAVALVALAVAVAVSKASVIYTTWPLVTFQILFVAVGMGLQKRLLSTRIIDAYRSEQPSRFAMRCVVTSGLTLGLLLIHGTIGTFFAGAGATTLVILSIVDRRDKTGAGRLQMIAGVVASTIACYRFAVGRSSTAARSNVAIDPSEAAGQLTQVADYAQTTGAHILEPTIAAESLTLQLGTGRSLVQVVVAVAAVTIVAVAARDLRRNGFLVASAATLMAILGGTAVAASTRNPNLQIWAGALAAQRYDHYFAVLLAILLTVVARFVGARPTSPFGFLIAGVVLVEVVILTYRAVVPSEAMAVRSLAVANKEEVLTYMEGTDTTNTFSLTGTVAGNNGEKVYEPVLTWLYDNQINVFDPDQVLHPQTEAYKTAKNLIATNPSREPAAVGGDRCVRITSGDGVQAWQAKLEVIGADRWHVRVTDDGTGEILDQYMLLPGRVNLLGLIPDRDVVQVCPSDQARIDEFHYTVAID